MVLVFYRGSPVNFGGIISTIKVQNFRIPGKLLDSSNKFLDILNFKDYSCKNIQVYCQIFCCTGKMSCPNLAMGKPHHDAAPTSQEKLCWGGSLPAIILRKENAQHRPCLSFRHSSSLFQVLLIVSSWPFLLYSLSYSPRITGERNSRAERKPLLGLPIWKSGRSQDLNLGPSAS